MFSIQGFLTCQSKLPMTYKHLSQVERYHIYALMKAGHDQTQIAKLLDRHKSTISRELSRNRGLKGYLPKQVCELAAKRFEQSRNTASEGFVWTMPRWKASLAHSNLSTSVIVPFCKGRRSRNVTQPWPAAAWV